MRQIVELDRADAHGTGNAWPANTSVSGRAEATAWYGARTQVEWHLARAIGFLLVTEATLEARCAAGNTTRLQRGDLLILNEGTEPYSTFLLSGEHSASCAANDGVNQLPRALHGLIQPAHALSGAQPFAKNPAWSMAVARLSEREFARASMLGQLLADESRLDAADNARLVRHLEATLFEALANALWTRDPMSLPQLAACGDKRIAKALMAMTADPGKPWRIESMAREAAMSRTAFAMQFKKVLGKTPLDYLTALRVQHAITLLETERAQSIDCIAREVGYADESAFRRAYLRASGQPLRRREAQMTR